MNPKTLNADNFDKKIQSGTLLKILQDYGIELIFIDEYNIISRVTRFTNWMKRVKS